MRKIFFLGLIVIFAIGGAWLARPAAAGSTGPDLIEGNPSCTGLGYAHGLKFDASETPGTYPLGGGTITWSVNGPVLDWSSTVGIDAVIMKGGPAAHLYIYDPPAESLGDSGLITPPNPNNKEPYGFSHVEFCFDYELVVSKTAVPAFTRTYAWEIEKSVDPAELHLFTGGSGAVDYTVAVTQTGYTDSDWAVSGAVTIYNPAPEAATITEILDKIDGVVIDTDCATPVVLAGGGTLTCNYNAVLPDGASRVNQVWVTTSGTVGGGEAQQGFAFGTPTTEVNASINVTDTNGQSWMTGGAATWPYDETFECSTDLTLYTDGYYSYTHDNTAEITETGQSDDAQVTVHCYAPLVSKTAQTRYVRTYEWQIAKSASVSALTLAPAEVIGVPFSVLVSVSGFTDGAWAVSGDIFVQNLHPTEAMTVAVADLISPDIVPTLDCAGTLTVPAGETGSCGYSAPLPDGSARTNTATITLNAVEYGAQAAVTFGDPAELVDACADVYDDLGVPGAENLLGQVCQQAAPVTYQYTLDLGPFATCGQYQHSNVASLVTVDQRVTRTSDSLIAIDVPCGGCTLTQGYWKTHSERGPAPYDMTWGLLDANLNGVYDRSAEPFYLSGMDWYAVFHKPPAGDPYFNLAHQYQAAVLNYLAGASAPPEVLAAIAWAHDFFQNNAPGQTYSKAEKSAIVKNAGSLDKYNNGLIGPGHCSE